MSKLWFPLKSHWGFVNWEYWIFNFFYSFRHKVPIFSSINLIECWSFHLCVCVCVLMIDWITAYLWQFTLRGSGFAHQKFFCCHYMKQILSLWSRQIPCSFVLSVSLEYILLLRVSIYVQFSSSLYPLESIEIFLVERFLTPFQWAVDLLTLVKALAMFFYAFRVTICISGIFSACAFISMIRAHLYPKWWSFFYGYPFAVQRFWLQSFSWGLMVLFAL